MATKRPNKRSNKEDVDSGGKDTTSPVAAKEKGDSPSSLTSVVLIPLVGVVGYIALDYFGRLLRGSDDAALVLTHDVHWQYLSGLLIGMGVGGVVGASTVGVAMFSLIAPEGHLREFTAIVPIVNVIANLATVSVYLKHANWQLCWRMWPYILIGIGLGTGLISAGTCSCVDASCDASQVSGIPSWKPDCAAGQTFILLLKESLLKRLTSIVYACVLAQRLYESAMEYRAAQQKEDKGVDDTAQRRAAFYNQTWVGASVGILCGIVTVVTNNSGPIFNIYLLACGLNMNEFVASRSVMMAGKNVAKAGARILAGGISWPVAVHGVQVGLLTILGIQIAKPIKARTSPEFYTYFTWCVLAYTTVKMW